MLFLPIIIYCQHYPVVLWCCACDARNLVEKLASRAEMMGFRLFSCRDASSGGYFLASRADGACWMACIELAGKHLRPGKHPGSG